MLVVFACFLHRSTSQAGYDTAVKKVFACLNKLESNLDDQRFLMGDKMTATDVMMLPTISRFDAVYATLFKCGKRRIKDYPNLLGWMKLMFRFPGSFESFDLDDSRRSYFEQLFPMNPSLIVPSGPSWEDIGIDPGQGRMSNQEVLDYVHVV